MRFHKHADTITFDDGGMNLLSSDALRELRDVIERWDKAALVFKMTRAAGADMSEMARFTPLEAYEFAKLGQETFAAIEKLPCLTIAEIDGDCFGGALDLILAFDLRFASARSRFSHPGAKLGIVTGFGGTSRWRKVIDAHAARRLFIANEILDAQQALDLGLIDSIGSPATWQPGNLHTRFIKELSLHRDRLTQSQFALLAERLAALYNVGK